MLGREEEEVLGREAEENENEREEQEAVREEAMVEMKVGREEDEKAEMDETGEGENGMGG